MYEPQHVSTVQDVYRELLRVAAAINDLEDPRVIEWTPELWDASLSGAEGQAYGAATFGYYHRIGDLVFINGRLVMTGLGTLATAQAARIGNLPYSVSQSGAITVGQAAGMSLGGAYAVHSYPSSDTSYLSLRKSSDAAGGSDLTIGEFSATGDLLFAGWYRTEDKE